MSIVLIRCGWGVALYGAALMVAATLPHDAPPMRSGVPWCDDDWCMTIESFSRAGNRYTFALQLSSLANRGPRHAKGSWICLTDQRGRRFFPVHDSSAIPLDVDLLPKAPPVMTALTFDLPPDSQPQYLEGGLDHIGYASFMIGSGDLAGKPRLRLRLHIE